jgi:membrane protein
VPFRKLPAPVRAAAREASLASWGSLRYYLVGLGKRLMTDNIPLWSQAIAFKVLVTLLPLLVLGTGVFGLIIRQDDPFATVASYLRRFLPAYQSEQLIEVLAGLQTAGSTITIVGAVALLLTVITLFTTLRFVVGYCVGQDRHHERPLLHGYLFDARMGAQVGLLFLVSFAITFGVNLLSTESTATLTQWGLPEAMVTRGWGYVGRALSMGLPFLLSVLMFMQLFYFVPRPHPPKRSALTGALVTAVLFELAKNVFTVYATYLGGFDRYKAAPKEPPPGADVVAGAAEAAQKAGDALGGIGGFFGLILALVFWVYLSGLILCIGAMVVPLHEARHREPSPLAPLFRLGEMRRKQATKNILTEKAREAAQDKREEPSAESESVSA